MIHAQRIRFFWRHETLVCIPITQGGCCDVCMCLVRLTPCVWQRQLPLRCGSRDVGGSGQLLCRLCHLQRFHSLLPDPGYGVVTFSFVMAVSARLWSSARGDSALSLLQPILRDPRLPSAAPAVFPLVTPTSVVCVSCGHALRGHTWSSAGGMCRWRARGGLGEGGQ